MFIDKAIDSKVKVTTRPNCQKGQDILSVEFHLVFNFSLMHCIPNLVTDYYTHDQSAT